MHVLSLISALALTTVSLAQTNSAAVDPCTVASATYWVSAQQAHACETNVRFNKTRSLSIVDTAIKFLQFYTLQDWQLDVVNPQIPAAYGYNITDDLVDIQKKTKNANYATNWDFDLAVGDAFDRLHDGHTYYEPYCSLGFSWNLPFSVATLANKPTDAVSVPYLFQNYDFPSQNRPGMEQYYLAQGLNARLYDGLQLVAVEGEDAATWLLNLANGSTFASGIFGGFETLQTRYMRVMSRYSCDTVSGNYSQDVGRFGQRAFYPGQNSIDLTVAFTNGTQTTLTVPWTAHFVGLGNTTESFANDYCGIDGRKIVAKPQNEPIGNRVQQKVAVVQPDSQPAARSIFAADATPINYVQPNLTSFGHLDTLDIYQLKQHPKVGVAYFEQFEPQENLSYDYFTEMSSVIYSAFTALKQAGVEHLLVDISGNRGGYIYAGAIAMWSFWPKDLYPGFPAVLRELNIQYRESLIAANTSNYNSDYFYGNYRDLNYNLFTNNSQIFDPPQEQTVNGVADYYSQKFFDDFGANSSVVTNFTSPPFKAKDIVLVSNSICASTCSIFSSYLFQKHGVRSAVFGGLPNQTLADAQFDGGVKGSEILSLEGVLEDLDTVGLQNDPAAPQPLPVEASFSVNFRNAIPYIDKKEKILEFVFEEPTVHFQYTKATYNNPQSIWEYTADYFFGSS